MSPKALLQCAIAFAAAMPLYAHAESFNAKTGTWEMTSTTVMHGITIPPEALAKMTPEQRATMERNLQAQSGKPVTRVRKSCVTQKKLDQDTMVSFNDDHAHCTQKTISKSASKITVERTCPSPYPYTATWIVEAPTPESLTAVVDVAQQSGGKVHVDVKGRWLGAGCDGVKDAGEAAK